MINPNGMDQLDGSIMGTSIFESGIVERLDNLFTQDASYLADHDCVMANSNMLDNLMAGGLTENLLVRKARARARVRVRARVRARARVRVGARVGVRARVRGQSQGSGVRGLKSR